jgi:hypothetical protein
MTRHGLYHLYFEQESTINGVVNRLRLVGKSKQGQSESIQVDYLHVGKVNLSEPPVLDGFVCALIFYLMQNAHKLHVHGPVSIEFIKNIFLFGEAWRCWLPSTYEPIEIEASTYISINSLGFPQIIKSALGLGNKKSSILTFSGGVDASFSLMRHAAKNGTLRRHESYAVSDVVLIHGFDVRWENEKGFCLLQKRLEPILDFYGVNCNVVKTNIRVKEVQNWEHSFVAQLASVLHQYSDKFYYGLVGSSEAYTHLINAWGSHPATDYLLSGEFFRVVHDGAGHTRTKKVAALKSLDVVTSNIKVCWEGLAQEKNCGFCEKCIRTKLNFIAAGSEMPGCFENGLLPGDVLNVPIRNIAARNEFLSILEYAEENGISGSVLLQALKDRLHQEGT